MKPKILFLSRYYLPTIGGIEQHIYKISSYLKDEYEVHLATVLENEFKSEEIIEGVLVHRKTVLGFIRFDLTKFDIVFIENFNIYPHIIVCSKLIFLKLFKKYSGKIIFVPHGGFTISKTVFSLPVYILKEIYSNSFGLFFIYKSVNKVIAVSDWEKTALISKGVKKEITVIRNGIEVVDSQGEQEKENYFLFVGRIDPIKNIEAIIKTYKDLRQNISFKDFKLLIVGPYSETNKYYKYLKSLSIGYEDKILFLGPRFGKEKTILLAKANCLFCFSKFESDSIVVKEALNLKTKVCIIPNAALQTIKTKKMFLF